MTHEEQATLDIISRHAPAAAGTPRPDQSLADDLGIDSLKFIVLVLEIEQGLKRKVFDVENVARLRTVGDLLGLVATAPATP